MPDPLDATFDEVPDLFAAGTVWRQLADVVHAKGDGSDANALAFAHARGGRPSRALVRTIRKFWAELDKFPDEDDEEVKYVYLTSIMDLPDGVLVEIDNDTYGNLVGYRVYNVSAV